MKLIYLKSALKCDSFDVAIDIKVQFFRVLVPIESDRSLLQFVTTNCLMKEISISNFDRTILGKKGGGCDLVVLQSFCSYNILRPMIRFDYP